MDDSTQLADQYENEMVWDGLELVEFSTLPHCDSNHTESPSATLTGAFMEANRIPYIAMRDADVYVSNVEKGQFLAAKSSQLGDDAVRLGGAVR